MPDLASTLAKLPPRCFARLPSTSENAAQRHPPEGRRAKLALIAILRGEPEYHPVASVLTPEQLNAGLAEPPSPEQAEAMLAGSMFGWDVPGADPDQVRASRARSPYGDHDLSGLPLPGALTAVRSETGVVLRDGAGEEIAALPPNSTARDVEAHARGYVAGACWGYLTGHREGMAHARRTAAGCGTGEASSAVAEAPGSLPAVAEWGGPDAPFRLEGRSPIRPGASPTLDRLWTRSGGHLGLYGWLRVADRRAKTVFARGLCDLTERDWRSDYEARVPPGEAADVAIDEHAAQHGTGPVLAHGHARPTV